MDLTCSTKVTNVIHKAMIEVNEEGAEASAATAVILSEKKCVLKKTLEIICEKPFIYTVTHLPSDTIIFFGKVTNPLKN